MARARRGLIGLIVSAVLLAGCAIGSPSPSSVSTPAHSVSADGSACEPIRLVSPGGEPVDVTGTWDGGVFLHHVRQVGDCVWWIGYARWPGTEPGGLATLTFSGRIATDFTIAGTWASIVRPDNAPAYYPGPLQGPATFLIEFDPESGTPSLLTLTGYDPNTLSDDFPIPYPSQVLRWVGPLPESTTPDE